MEHKGALKVASALEVLHAQLMAMHRDCTSDQVEPLVLSEWLVMACSCVVTFKLLDGPADIGLQRILQVAFAKPLIESRVGEGVLSNARYAQWCNELITYSANSEPLSETFIKMGMSAYQKAFKHKQILDVVTDLDKLGDQSCFFRVAVIYHTASKAGSGRDLVELFEFIAYLQKMSLVDTSELSDG